MWTVIQYDCRYAPKRKVHNSNHHTTQATQTPTSPIQICLPTPLLCINHSSISASSGAFVFMGSCCGTLGNEVGVYPPYVQFWGA